MASHLLDEVQKVCSHVAVIKMGKKLYEGQVQSLLAEDGGIEVSSDNLGKLDKALAIFDGVDQVKKQSGIYTVKLKSGFKSSELSAFLITNGVDITHFANKKGNLEQEFLNLLSQVRD